MSPAAARIAPLRHQRDQLRQCLADWPRPDTKTPARVARVRSSARKLDDILRDLSGHLIAGDCRGH